MTHTNNPTEAEIDELLHHVYESGTQSIGGWVREDHVGKPINPEEAKAKIMQLLHQYGNTRELEGRIDELKNTGGPNDGYESIGHLLASNVKERISELTKAKGEAR